MRSAERWIARQEAAGWPSYDRAVYAWARLGVPWPRPEDPEPDSKIEVMRTWWRASRYGGLAPEDVRWEIEDAAAP